MKHLGYTYTKMQFLIYLKFKLNWAFCVLSGNPSLDEF